MVPNKGTTVLFWFRSYQQCYFLQKIEEFKDFLKPLSDFPVLFKAYLIFKDFSRKPSKFKYFSSMCQPGQWLLAVRLKPANTSIPSLTIYQLSYCALCKNLSQIYGYLLFGSIPLLSLIPYYLCQDWKAQERLLLWVSLVEDWCSLDLVEGWHRILEPTKMTESN